jgi:formylglycine-generating enzyme
MSLRFFGASVAAVTLLAACGSGTQDTDPSEGGAGAVGGSGGMGGTLPVGGGGQGGFGGTMSTTGSTSTTSTTGTTTSTLTDYDCAVAGVMGQCLDVADCAMIPDFHSTAGFCPGPANIQCCTPNDASVCDPMEHVYPNDGNILEEPGEGGCPAGMIPVTDYCVDKYEASLVRGDDGTSWSPYFNPGAIPMIAVSVANAVPQGYIDGDQASEACLNAGKRLCTNTEWLRACRGPNDTTYPYGNTKMLGVCNDHRSVHPAAEYYGTTDSWIYSHIDNACLNQLPDSLDRAGENAGCVTYEGAYDMMGNLHEWTSDPAGTFRGGYYVDTVLNGPGCVYVTTAHNTLHWDYSTGFRCCADP